MLIVDWFCQKKAGNMTCWHSCHWTWLTRNITSVTNYCFACWTAEALRPIGPHGRWHVAGGCSQWLRDMGITWSSSLTCGSRELIRGRDVDGGIKRSARPKQTSNMASCETRQTPDSLWSAADKGFYCDVMNGWKPGRGHRFDTELNWSFL